MSTNCTVDVTREVKNALGPVVWLAGKVAGLHPRTARRGQVWMKRGEKMMAEARLDRKLIH